MFTGGEWGRAEMGPWPRTDAQDKCTERTGGRDSLPGKTVETDHHSPWCVSGKVRDLSRQAGNGLSLFFFFFFAFSGAGRIHVRLLQSQRAYIYLIIMTAFQ